ncbi:MAG: hypothetical protein GY790_01445 [Bacteroidetes bacterium]|nr:hypothetical protein [Bacteroidota bacterium]
MVKVSTLFHRVDGFDGTRTSDETRETPEQNIETQFLTDLLEPLLFDPGDELMQRILREI